MFWVLLSIIVCFLFRARACTYSETGDFHQRIFNTETVSVWRTLLHDDDWHVRQDALKILFSAMNHSMLSRCFIVCTHNWTGGLQQQMFDTETVSVWRSMLHDSAWDVRQEALNILGFVITHSMLSFFFWLVSVITAGQMAFVNRCSTPRQYPCRVVGSATITQLSAKKP